MKKFDGTPNDLKSKETLARLLAAEGVTVRYGHYPTASFDLQSRCLRKPIFSKAVEEVDDLFTLHEVAHGLWTPTEGWHSALHTDKLQHRVLNILEDVRIERLIKRKYPGAARTMHIGYTVLSKDFKFFGDLRRAKNYSFIDRLNVFSKLGTIEASTMFTAREMPFVDRAMATESWEEVVDLAKALVEEGLVSAFKKINLETGATEESEFIGESKGAIHGGEAPDGDTEEPEQEKSLPTEFYPEPGCTDRASKEFEEGMQQKFDGYRNPVVYISKTKPSSVESINQFSARVTNAVAFREKTIPYELSRVFTDLEEFRSALRGRYSEWASLIRKEATELASEFENKKKAHSIAFSTVSKTGRLDTKKLHMASIRDDIFKRKTITKKGKSHSFTLLVDASGSMGSMIGQVMDQAMVMLQMCALIDVKADVYTYTSGGGSDNTHGEGNGLNLVHVGSTKDMKNSLRNGFFGIARTLQFTSNCKRKINESMYFRGPIHMGGTPTATAILAMEELMRGNLAACEVNNLIVFTDGDSDGIAGQKTEGTTRSIEFVIPNNRNWQDSITVFDEVTGKLVYSGDNIGGSEKWGKNMRAVYSSSAASIETAARILRARLRREFNLIMYVSSTSAAGNIQMYYATSDKGKKLEAVPGGVQRYSTEWMPSVDAIYFLRADPNSIGFAAEDDVESLLEEIIKRKKKGTDGELDEKAHARAIASAFARANENRMKRRSFGKRVIQDIAGLGF